MKYRILLWLALTAALTTAQAAAGTGFILRAAPANADGIASRHGLTVVGPIDDQNRGIFLVQGPAGASPDQVVADVRSDTDVLEFESNGDVLVPERPELLPGALTQSTANILDALANKTLTSYFGAQAWVGYTSQPAASLVRIADAQALATGAGIVAIIDTGVDPNHPVLQRSIVPGYDFVRNVPGVPSEFSDLTQSTANILDQSTANLLDGTTVKVVNPSTAAILTQSTANILDTTQLPAAFGHGTMVAGIVHLVAPTAQIMPLKAFRGDGSSDVFSILRAIYYAADHGARVINMSFSFATSSAELMRAINYATGRGVTCVSSVGNSGRETLVFPAAFKNVVGVASTNNLDGRSTFSNYGSALAHMAAPGEAIVTTYPGGRYAAAWGTSFSTPFVAGGGALLVQIKLGLEQSDAVEALSHAKKISDDLGYGRLDLYRAVSSLVKQ